MIKNYFVIKNFFNIKKQKIRTHKTSSDLIYFITFVLYGSNPHRTLFYTKSNQTVTLLTGGRGWTRAPLESSLASQAIAFVLCGSNPLIKK